jgi:lycopene beta-cyclase
VSVKEKHYDVLIVGAGLAGLSLAYQLKAKHPTLKLLILDKMTELPGNKTWSFHEGDLDSIAPWSSLVTRTWPRHEVRFQSPRILESPYYTVAAAAFFERMTQELGESLQLGTSIEALTHNTVRTGTGETLNAELIFDSRPDEGFSLNQMESVGWGFQKFLGLEVTTQKPHGLKHPILMDATVPQRSGYRFLYTLPLTESTLLVEDTRYSNSAELEIAEYRAEVHAYCQRQGWEIRDVIREETGILPIPTSKVATNAEMAPAQPLRIGYGAGLFHPVTGYSLPWCFRLAERIAALPILNYKNCLGVLEKVHQEHQQTRDFYLFLNRLMFEGALPDKRYRIFERFYRLPKATIDRFYASATTWSDRFRLLVGRPPISIFAALKVVFSRPRALPTSLAPRPLKGKI